MPFRFVWQTDAGTRFTLGSEEFAKLLGEKTAATLNRPWSEIADALKLDQDGRVAAALASRDTWSGIVVSWPVDDMTERLPVEMSGLPIFDRDRQFAGYRGFGICRDLEALAAIERKRAEPKPEPNPEPKLTPPTAPDAPSANVLAFPAAPPPVPVQPPTLVRASTALSRNLRASSAHG